MYNTFWLQSPSSLFDDFTIIPNVHMDEDERFNSLTRLILLLTIILYFFSYKHWLLFLIIGIIVIIFLWKNRNMSVKIKGFQAKKKNLHSVDHFDGTNDYPERKPDLHLNNNSSQFAYNSDSSQDNQENYDERYAQPLTTNQYKNHAQSFSFHPTSHKDYSSASDHPTVQAHYNNLKIHETVIKEVVIIEPILISEPEEEHHVTYKETDNFSVKHPSIRIHRDLHEEQVPGSVKHPHGKYNITHETVAKPFTKSSNFSMVTALNSIPQSHNNIHHNDIANHFIHKRADKHRELHQHHKAHENTIRHMLFRPPSPENESEDEYEYEDDQ
jgi:hypothetical protein